MMNTNNDLLQNFLRLFSTFFSNRRIWLFSRMAKLQTF